MPFLAAHLGELPPGGPLDAAVAFTVSLLFQGKFFLVFAFLFGWGVGVQLDASARAGRPFAPRFFRRQAGLLLIGAAHAVFVFAGDILVTYAIAGCLLFLLRDRATDSLLRWSIAGIIVGMASLCIVAIEASATLGQPGLSGAGYLGSFAQSISQRVSDLGYVFPFILLFNGPLVLAAFCAGLAAQKSGFLIPGNALFGRLWQVRYLLLATGVAANLPFALVVADQINGPLSALGGFASLALAAPLLSLTYIVFVAGWAVPRGESALTIAGQMSLTAYVLEGVLAGFVFNGYGLALYGQLGMAAITGVAISVFIVTELACRSWQYIFGVGPLERILRVVAQ